MSDTLLRVDGVTQRFGHGEHATLALDDVSLEVRRGETLGLVGESGSGKSTLARAILLMRRPSSGCIEFDGGDVSRLRGSALRTHRRRVQMVFQDPNDSLDPRFTVARSIAEPLVAAGLGAAARRARVVESLHQVGLPGDAAGRFPHEFSGGQRQRIAIARAMAAKPEFVVLDEPTSALDVSVQAQVLNLLVRLQEETGVTYLFITHNLAVVHHVAHRVAVMRNGRVVEEGTGEQVMTRPQDAYTRELLESMPVLYRT
ncbi:peptide ABC transporter ATP-binding protein [Plantibacter sp. H53]|uniref:ABC transporter ATP-binding protein n=1 Tax=unclassified Plantibacter TaxID=2624265 RepID=UPI0007D9CB9A|nr:MULTISPECIES: ATP-binding cassette domain-containing protein [unclassified Plantibacter]OAN32875.1 peptide ABC transporter ATP-binding protein [Plantibacter sp. H53]OII41390.1 peptide ABC transporter ATP-binding protein [Plantibacter sp. MMLR14_011]